MRLHVVGLPHTRFIADFSWCAYTTKVQRFAAMMGAQGVEVITYGNGKAWPLGELYVTVTDEEFEPHYIPDFSPADPVFANFNAKATAAIMERLGPDDIICIIGGAAQITIAGAFPSNKVVEFGIGYAGVFAKYRVFESYAWRHAVVGAHGGLEHDDVIHNFYDPDDFMSHEERRDDFVFLGRVCKAKGVELAVDACRQAGVPLKIAGHVYDDARWVEELQGDIEYIGEVDPAERRILLGTARGVITPSVYLEPFCGVHAEALLSGAPVYCPDFGVFTETITNGFDGWRCRSLDDLTLKVGSGWALPAERIRQKAIALFSVDVIGPKYVDYFERIK